MQTCHKQHGGKEEDEHGEAELIGEVAHVGKQEEACRNQCKPDVLPAEDRPRREVRGDPGQGYDQHDKREFVVADTAVERNVEPRSYPLVQLLVARPGSRAGDDTKDRRERHGRAHREREQVDHGLRPPDAREHRGHQQSDERKRVERWHLIHPSGAVDGVDDGEHQGA